MQTQQTETPDHRQDGRLVNRQMKTDPRPENRPDKTDGQTPAHSRTLAACLGLSPSESQTELKCHRTFLKMESVVAQICNIYPQLCGNIIATSHTTDKSMLSHKLAISYDSFDILM